MVGESLTLVVAPPLNERFNSPEELIVNDVLKYGELAAVKTRAIDADGFEVGLDPLGDIFDDVSGRCRVDEFGEYVLERAKEC